jgi:hemerythrin-like domain-containing protein
MHANGGYQTMPKLIELLREEHRDIEKLLLVLEDELSVFDRQERPDYEVIQAVIRYFQDYPDCCHHPKEDMIFEKIKARDPVAAKSVGDLKAEHQHEARRLQRVADVVRNILLDREIPRQTVDDVIHDFIAKQRAHMQMEERVLFQAAVDTLRPNDWAEIDLRWSDQKDTLFNVGIEERCLSLRDHILQWARDNKENRV